MRAFALRNILPLSKSAPLACCALMILSVSSRRVGIKRRAMDMVIAISWVGTPTRDRGPISRSIPSVSAIGFVVKVSREEPMISRISRTAMKTAVYNPSAVIFRNPHCQSTLPDTMKIFRQKVKMMISKIGLSPRRIKDSGTFERATTAASAAPQRANPIKLSAMNSSAINKIVQMIFSRESSR